MRIAFVPAARVLSEREPNGEALIAVGIIKQLAARGHTIIAYCERSNLDPIDGVEVREVPVQGPTVALARVTFAAAIARAVARDNVDVAHLLFPLSTEDGYTFVRSAPVVAGPIFLPWPQQPKAPEGFIRRAVTRVGDLVERRSHETTLARAARILVTGASSRAALTRYDERCFVVPFAIDLDRFKPEPFPDQPTIVFPSVIQERKGIHVLIDAMPSVLERVPNARAIIAGGDPEGLKPALERRATDLGVGGAITYRDGVSPVDMPALYASGSLICQPSFGEPFGMTVIEAMAAGRPVVGTDAGGIPDAVVDPEGGRLVPTRDPDALARALVEVLSDPEAAGQMGEFNRERAARKYSWDAVIGGIEQAYAAAVRTKGDDAVP